jgi:rhodanese-related sulfurtransferase
LSGQVLCYNALTSQTSILKINKSEAQIEKVLKEKHTFHLKQLDSLCDFQSEVISIKDVANLESSQFIDVREAHEQPKVEGLQITYTPLNQLEINHNQIDTSKDIYIFCQSGIRSKQAVSSLRSLGISNSFSIKEGAPEIINFINTTVQSHSDDR